MYLNFQSSVVGLVFVELQTDAGMPIPGYTLAESDPLRGNFIAKAATWNGGTSTLQSQLLGDRVRIKVAMTDTSLFSVEVRCSESSILDTPPHKSDDETVVATKQTALRGTFLQLIQP